MRFYLQRHLQRDNITPLVFEPTQTMQAQQHYSHYVVFRFITQIFFSKPKVPELKQQEVLAVKITYYLHQGGHVLPSVCLPIFLSVCFCLSVSYFP